MGGVDFALVGFRREGGDFAFESSEFFFQKMEFLCHGVSRGGEGL